MVARTRLTSAAFAALAAVALVALSPQPARGHCDAMDGPVVRDAKVALAENDVTPVLKWVLEDDEDEVRTAFERTMTVRGKGDDARELADLWFFETLVRLHRASEGAPYTGLKPAGTPVPAPVAKADEALAEGSVEGLAAAIGEHAANGVRERFARTFDVKTRMGESVEAGRKYVEAYVEYVHYVKHLHGAIAGHGEPHGEAPGDERAHPEH